MDHISRQDVIEVGVGIRQGIGETIVQAHREAARRGRLAHHGEAGRVAVDGLDIKGVLGGQQLMPPDANRDREPA